MIGLLDACVHFGFPQEASYLSSLNLIKGDFFHQENPFLDIDEQLSMEDEDLTEKDLTELKKRQWLLELLIFNGHNYHNPIMWGLDAATLLEKTKIGDHLRKIAALKESIEAGLVQGTSKSMLPSDWSNFLTRGLYDPRLFLTIWDYASSHPK
ncbi:MAG: hypothetical protein AB7E68_06040 [Candidatus Babeliales bacterium]